MAGNHREREASRAPSMKDVAAAAGVSHQTVSRVLNGAEKVAPATRQRVLEQIAALGYRRNSAARALVTRRSGILGVITSTSVHFGPSSILLAVELAARQVGYFTAVAPVEHFTHEALDQALDYFLSLSAEGIIIIAPIEDVADAGSVARAGVPLVGVTSQALAATTGLIPVSVDQEGGARDAVQHLLSLGHTEIVHVPGPPGWFEAQARQAAWQQAMTQAGLPARVVGSGSWEAAAGYEAGRQLLREGLPTGVFAANDELALGLIRALVEAGLSVPGDVSVVGFDDIPVAPFYLPPLTTVRQDFIDLGRQVVATLVDAIGGSTQLPVVRPARLVVRKSTAPPTSRR